MRLTAHTLLHAALPHVLVVVNTEAKLFNPIITQQKFHASIMENMRDLTEYTEVNKAEKDFQSKFYSV